MKSELKLKCKLNLHHFSLARFIVSVDSIMPILRCNKCQLEKHGEIVSSIEYKGDEMSQHYSLNIKH